MADKSELDIIKELYNSFGNNPNNVETFNTLANINPLLAAYRGAKSLSNVSPKALGDFLMMKYQTSDTPKQDIQRAGQSFANLASGAMDVVPTLGLAKVGAKPTAKALGKALEMTENMPVGLSIKDVSRPLTDFEKAHKLAQERAALPYSEGGLNLPANNTAMQRARAMGMETQPSKEMYHYAREGWENNQIDPSKSDLGFHTGTIEQANHRGNVFLPHESGGNIMPLMKSKYANMLKVNDEGTFHADSFSPQLEKKGLVSKGYTKKIMADPLGNTSPNEWDLIYDQKMRDILTQNDYHGVKYNNAQEGEGISYAFTDPTIVRSRFAAFDPFRRNENDILAGVGVGALPFIDYNKKK
jgi:hypothetical protein